MEIEMKSRAEQDEIDERLREAQQARLSALNEEQHLLKRKEALSRQLELELQLRNAEINLAHAELDSELVSKDTSGEQIPLPLEEPSIGNQIPQQQELHAKNTNVGHDLHDGGDMQSYLPAPLSAITMPQASAALPMHMTVSPPPAITVPQASAALPMHMTVSPPPAITVPQASAALPMHMTVSPPPAITAPQASAALSLPMMGLPQTHVSTPQPGTLTQGSSYVTSFSPMYTYSGLDFLSRSVSFPALGTCTASTVATTQTLSSLPADAVQGQTSTSPCGRFGRYPMGLQAPSPLGTRLTPTTSLTTPLPCASVPVRALPTSLVGLSSGQCVDPVSTGKSFPETYHPISQQMMLSSMLAASAGGINVEVPHFSGGDPSEYRCFESMINGCIKPLIHLSELQKYFIVKSKLSGQPKKDILGMEHDPAPFTKAMSTLQRLYGDIGVLIRAKIEKLTVWPRVAASDAKGLIEFASAVSALVTQLENAPEGAAELRANSTACVLHGRLSSQHQTAFLKRMETKGIRTFSLVDFNSWLKETATVARKRVQLEDSLRVGPQAKQDHRRRGISAYHTEGGGRSQSQSVGKGMNDQISSVSKSAGSGKKPFKKVCPFCKNDHWLSRCGEFGKLTTEEKIKWLKDGRRCWQCARLHREGQNCDLKKACRECDQLHLTVLHNLIKQPGYGIYYSSFNPNLSAFYGDGNPWSPGQVSMKIVPVILYGNGSQLKTHCLLDDAANFSMMLPEAVKALNLKGKRTEMPIATAREECTPCRGTVLNLEMAPESDPSNRIEVSNVFSSPMLRLSEHSVPVTELRRRWPHLRDLPLTDCKDVHPLMLIGSDRADLIVPIESHFGPEGAPVAVRTKLGWAVQGPVLTDRCRGEVNHLQGLTSREADEVLHESVCRMWQNDVQMYSERKQVTRSKQDQRAVDLLESKSTYVEVSGVRRVATPLLWRCEEDTFFSPASSVLPALRRNERRLEKNPDLAEINHKKIQELREAGLVSTVGTERKVNSIQRQWYIPYHIVKQNSKHRLVFNCAFQYQGESLNDRLLPGPSLGSTLVGVLLRFRRHLVAVSGDIKAMFHCVQTREEDRSALRFLWRELGSEAEPTQFEWNVLPFGTTCSPCCATYALQKHVKDNTEDPDVVRSVLEAFYVDNCLDGKPTAEEAKVLVEKLVHSLGTGGFPIVKWASNVPSVVSGLPLEARSTNADCWMNLNGSSPEEAALGPRWNFQDDTLNYQIALKDHPIPTRRTVLSDVMQCAGKDPLGYLMPYVVRGKMLLQELWKQPLNWDDEIADLGENGLQAKHLQWRGELADLPKISIPRCYTPNHFMPGHAKHELHVFTDASEKAYGAVAYLRATVSPSDVSVRFVMSRSRLAPKRVQTMPRLELQAAVSGAELADLLDDEMKMEMPITCWSDSTTVLSWIKSESCRYNRYVGARIAEIQRLTDHTVWRYVDSGNNPADDLTRGLRLDQLGESSRWHSPPFLLLSREQWPVLPVQSKQEEVEAELKHQGFAAHTVASTEPPPNVDFTKYASWEDLVEGYAAAISDSKGDPKPNFLTAEDRLKTEELLYRQVQADSFPEDVAALRADKDVSRKNRLVSLAPELDDLCQVIRVGGRLRRSPSIDETMKHPIVLDPKHPITRLLIQEADSRLGHCGTGTVLADLRRRFWVLRGRQAIRSLQSRCPGCLRKRGRPSVPKMADLPVARLRVGKPAFYSTGVDCFGPFSVSIGRRHEQRWGIIWKCLTTRAVYLDLLESLDSDAFLLAFSRFRSRRGTPHEILCDNGTNFKGGQTEMTNAFKAMTPSLQEKLAKHRVHFKFNPPTAPHFGGTWEREIRSVKSALYAILGNQTVSPSVLYTSLTEVEALLNSKPLSYISSDVADPDPITPFMLLMGRLDHAPPQLVYPDEDVLSRRRWRQCQALMQRFWKEFTQSYLPAMQARQKWRGEADNLKAGDVVLMVDPQQARASWPVAQVVEALPGRDGRVRTVKLQTGGREYIRPVARLILLPAEPDADSSDDPNP
ncbi:uncharacterized protein LOC110985885 [Acanthaster planci]|uniref:Uncharacterized protein LOC110985885 n=1 Tax=Acanthaster planci TaxID=133434 RepID=A0A8B7ZBI7_ACAPL|nr:uncharacterized protein LOC110985885 [Acanthaster planci]